MASWGQAVEAYNLWKKQSVFDSKYRDKKKLNLPRALVKSYYDHLICDLDPLKVKAMSLFFDSLYDQGILESRAQIKFFTP